ncbi:phosphopantothenoylcysteine decarboxylase [Papillibacter cinnamivorans]|uniref:Phosphopantothenate-cysteine ligase n=1 Tax=Papillibacter cinnamivorans DSM 12816 TaxID=1122930 RepID=A0A1W1ZIZ4_9FIRM|nr:phosphopantothenoylcysteine decarboxylase [Papillibacter cinnamivorans]SMC48510.1 phosphopantothenate-cysteine ligase [Papillibacter cinnamivorans DSM 12816]
MNIIVTSGGTREKIDEVRTIANSATGALGSLIASELLRRLPAGGNTLYYLCGAGAVTPGADPRLEVLPAPDTGSLESAMRTLLETRKIDAVIHAMAVSDYRVGAATTPDRLAAALSSLSSLPASPEEWEKVLTKALFQRALEPGGKISSELAHPILVLEKTPKIIHMIKELSPDTLLVGFKLLSGVSEETLLEVAGRLMETNRCDFVLANDTVSLKSGVHVGYLLCRRGETEKYTGKEAIASGIASRILKRLEEQAV